MRRTTQTARNVLKIAGFACALCAFMFGACALSGCAMAGARAGGDAAVRGAAEREVAALLSEFHHRAAIADFDGYFALFDERGVFLGTDAAERWPVPEFKEFARPHFEEPPAWVFVPVRQNITVSGDGSFAWFDEELKSESYGQCRGSGVAIRTATGWKIGQYNLTVPIPNDLLKDFVRRIRAAAAAPK